MNPQVYYQHTQLKNKQNTHLRYTFWTQWLYKWRSLKFTNNIPNWHTTQGTKLSSNFRSQWISNRGSLKFFINISTWCSIRESYLSYTYWYQWLSKWNHRNFTKNISKVYIYALNHLEVQTLQQSLPLHIYKVILCTMARAFILLKYTHKYQVPVSSYLLTHLLTTHTTLL